MSAVVIDASVWVSRLVPSDVHHSISRVWLERRAAAGDQFVTPTLALSEIAGAIARRTGRPSSAHDAVAAITRVPGLRLVSVDRRLAQLAARLAADHSLRGAEVSNRTRAIEPLCPDRYSHQ